VAGYSINRILIWERRRDRVRDARRNPSEHPFFPPHVSRYRGYHCGHVQHGGRHFPLAARVSESWIAFAETGNPNSKKSGLPEWPAYESQKRATMLFQNQSKVVNDPQSARRKAIQDVLG